MKKNSGSCAPIVGEKGWWIVLPVRLDGITLVLERDVLFARLEGALVWVAILTVRTVRMDIPMSKKSW